MSLKQQLVDWIKEKKYVSYGEIEREVLKGTAGKFGRMYKIDNARRRLDEVMKKKDDPLYTPHIRAVPEKNYIKGWEWKDDLTMSLF